MPLFPLFSFFVFFSFSVSPLSPSYSFCYSPQTSSAPRRSHPCLTWAVEAKQLIIIKVQQMMRRWQSTQVHLHVSLNIHCFFFPFLSFLRLFLGSMRCGWGSSFLFFLLFIIYLLIISLLWFEYIQVIVYEWEAERCMQETKQQCSVRYPPPPSLPPIPSLFIFIFYIFIYCYNILMNHKLRNI